MQFNPVVSCCLRKVSANFCTGGPDNPSEAILISGPPLCRQASPMLGGVAALLPAGSLHPSARGDDVTAEYSWFSTLALQLHASESPTCISASLHGSNLVAVATIPNRLDAGLFAWWEHQHKPHAHTHTHTLTDCDADLQGNSCAPIPPPLTGDLRAFTESRAAKTPGPAYSCAVRNSWGLVPRARAVSTMQNIFRL